MASKKNPKPRTKPRAKPRQKPKREKKPKNKQKFILAKVGSCLMHFAEYQSVDGRPIDLMQAKALWEDPEVQKWIKDQGPMVTLPRTDPVVILFDD